MKKIFSIVLFVLTIAVFVFAVYNSIAGAIAVDRQLAELAAREASGHELLGVGLDILLFMLALTCAIGFVMAIVSRKIAPYRMVRILSGVLCSLFWLPILICVCIVAW